MMNHPIHSNNDDMFILSSQVDYNSRPSVGGLVGYGTNAPSTGGLSHAASSSYSVYPAQQEHHHQQQQRTSSNNSRMYFTEELLDEGPSREIKPESTETPSYYGKCCKIQTIQQVLLTEI